MCMLQAHGGCLLHRELAMGLAGERPSESQGRGWLESSGSGPSSVCSKPCNWSYWPCALWPSVFPSPRWKTGFQLCQCPTWIAALPPRLQCTGYQRPPSPPRALLLQLVSNTASHRFKGFAWSPQRPACSPERHFVGETQGGREPEGGAVAPVVELLSAAGRYSQSLCGNRAGPTAGFAPSRSSHSSASPAS